MKTNHYLYRYLQKTLRKTMKEEFLFVIIVYLLVMASSQL